MPYKSRYEPSVLLFRPSLIKSKTSCKIENGSKSENKKVLKPSVIQSVTPENAFVENTAPSQGKKRSAKHSLNVRASKNKSFLSAKLTENTAFSKNDENTSLPSPPRISDKSYCLSLHEPSLCEPMKNSRKRRLNLSETSFDRPIKQAHKEISGPEAHVVTNYPATKQALVSRSDDTSLQTTSKTLVCSFCGCGCDYEDLIEWPVGSCLYITVDGKWVLARVTEKRTNQLKVIYYFAHTLKESWFDVNSPLLKPYPTLNSPPSVGDIVLAPWILDKRMYPAKVIAIVGRGFLRLSFFDGEKRTIHFKHVQMVENGELSHILSKLDFSEQTEMKKGSVSNVNQSATTKRRKSTRIASRRNVVNMSSNSRRSSRLLKRGTKGSALNAENTDEDCVLFEPEIRRRTSSASTLPSTLSDNNSEDSVDTIGYEITDSLTKVGKERLSPCMNEEVVIFTPVLTFKKKALETERKKHEETNVESVIRVEEHPTEMHDVSDPKPCSPFEDIDIKSADIVDQNIEEPVHGDKEQLPVISVETFPCDPVLLESRRTSDFIAERDINSSEDERMEMDENENADEEHPVLAFEQDPAGISLPESLTKHSLLTSTKFDRYESLKCPYEHCLRSFRRHDLLKTHIEYCHANSSSSASNEDTSSFTEHPYDIVHCVCGIDFKDENMIQCKECYCWQHKHCAGQRIMHPVYVCWNCSDKTDVTRDSWQKFLGNNQIFGNRNFQESESDATKNSLDKTLMNVFVCEKSLNSIGSQLTNLISEVEHKVKQYAMIKKTRHLHSLSRHHLDFEGDSINHCVASIFSVMSCLIVVVESVCSQSSEIPLLMCYQKQSSSPLGDYEQWTFEDRRYEGFIGCDGRTRNWKSDLPPELTAGHMTDSNIEHCASVTSLNDNFAMILKAEDCFLKQLELIEDKLDVVENEAKLSNTSYSKNCMRRRIQALIRKFNH